MASSICSAGLLLSKKQNTPSSSASFRVGGSSDAENTMTWQRGSFALI